jgi:organic radical activating enzyme
MKVSEIFFSIQGEGTNAGMPAVFLRLDLCNLRCGYCDTKYTWDWENYEYDKEVLEMSIEEVEREITKFECNHLVLTGGEPLIQQREAAILISRLKKDNGGFSVEVETNGTMLPDIAFVQCVDQWNVSPKLSNSANSLEKREVAKCYDFFARGVNNAYFKFVVKSQEDILEVESLAKKYGLPTSRVLLMPMATSPGILKKRSKLVIDACKERGYRYSPRLQIELWGSKRGT